MRIDNTNRKWHIQHQRSFTQQEQGAPAMAKGTPLSRDPAGLIIVTALYPITILPMWITAMFIIVINKATGARGHECYEDEHGGESVEDWTTTFILIVGTLYGLMAFYAFFGGMWLGFSLPQVWWIPGGIIYAACSFYVWRNFSQPLLEWTGPGN